MIRLLSILGDLILRLLNYWDRGNAKKKAEEDKHERELIDRDPGAAFDSMFDAPDDGEDVPRREADSAANDVLD